MSRAIFENFYKKQINKLTDNELVRSLFCKVPNSSIASYKKTLAFNATKEYSKAKKNLPNNFFSLLEESLNTNGALRTYKMYEEDFEKMEGFFGVEKKYFVDLLKSLLETKNSQARYKIIETFKTYIRGYNSKAKSHFQKVYTEKCLNNLKSICYKNESVADQNTNKEYTFMDFINDIKENNTQLYDNILEYMSLTSNIVIDDIYEDVFKAINDNENIDVFLNLFAIYKPLDYDENYVKKCKIVNRLNDNFKPILNSEEYSIEYKQALVEYINKKLEGSTINDELSSKISKKDKIHTEVLCGALKKLDGAVSLVDDQIIINHCVIRNTALIERYRLFDEKIASVSTFINDCKKRWIEEKNKKLKPQTKRSVVMTNLFDDASYTINDESYIHFKDLKALIDNINISKLELLTKDEFESLKTLLNDNYLLFSYLIGNITLDDILLIINNYSSIVYYVKSHNMNANDIDSLLKIAKTFTYVSDLEIALIGYENLVKIINYNQFAGLDVTEETIRNRIDKAVYLTIKSELTSKSSLPYDISAEYNGLKLERYLNNDPNALVSGVETKTCFFMSVNENDFFFYSFLNKNGFIVKIVDEQGNFVARASCFRRNNILMINGIRLKNNEIVPRNKDQKELMKKIVSLIEIMSEKLIYATSGDMCPIDYVVCNKAGILEYNEFDNKYEMIDFKLIREPINIYDKDWQEFISINDENPNMLQEAPINPKTSFTTDFGDNYPAILIKSRDNRGLLKPSDISLKDEEAVYDRPKMPTKVYTPAEITPNLLAKINRIRALYTYIGSVNRKQNARDTFRLLKSFETISKFVISEDWVCIIYKDRTYDTYYTNYDKLDYQEFQKYLSLEKINSPSGAKTYLRSLRKK